MSFEYHVNRLRPACGLGFVALRPACSGADLLRPSFELKNLLTLITGCQTQRLRLHSRNPIECSHFKGLPWQNTDTQVTEKVTPKLFFTGPTLKALKKLLQNYSLF